MRSVAIKVLVNALAIWVATLVVAGIDVRGPSESPSATLLTYLAIGVIFGLVNAVVRPVVKVLALPLYLLTLGLFTFVVNALMLQLTAWLSSRTSLRLSIDEFWPTAVLAALVVTLVSLVLNAVLPDGKD